jgi:hypothetical protein
MQEFNTSQKTNILKYVNTFTTYLKQKSVIYAIVRKAEFYSNTIEVSVDMSPSDKTEVKSLLAQYVRSHSFPYRDYVLEIKSVS